MIDIVDKKTRSRMMSGIRSKNTRPEILIRSLLHRNGFRFRIHDNKLAGRPDIVLKKYNAIIFVHGCFWHGHNCRLFKWPKTRPEFWKTKILGNRENDKKALLANQEKGLRICIVWECAIKGKDKDLPGVIHKISTWLVGESQFLEVVG